MSALCQPTTNLWNVESCNIAARVMLPCREMQVNFSNQLFYSKQTLWTLYYQLSSKLFGFTTFFPFVPPWISSKCNVNVRTTLWCWNIKYNPPYVRLQPPASVSPSPVLSTSLSEEAPTPTSQTSSWTPSSMTSHEIKQRLKILSSLWVM